MSKEKTVLNIYWCMKVNNPRISRGIEQEAEAEVGIEENPIQYKENQKSVLLLGKREDCRIHKLINH